MDKYNQRFNARTDANQKEIVEALRAKGATVRVMQGVGRGFPDLCVGWRGANYLLEVKTKKGRLNAKQKKFFESWGGQCAVVRTSAEAISRVFNVRAHAL